MGGVTDIGFDRETFSSIQTRIRDRLWADIDTRLILDETAVVGQLVDNVADQCAKLWEVLEDAYYASDPDNATGNALVALAELTGTRRRFPSRGVVTATVNLDGGRTYLAGSLVAHKDGNEDNRWYNLNDITTPTGGSSDYNVTYVSEDTGSGAYVGAGELTEIAETATGWNSITNVAEATAGEDLETIEELRERRTNELSKAGSATLQSIKAEVSALDGMLDVAAFENTTDSTVGIIGPHGFRIVVWDDSAVADNDIAQAIFDKRAAGIRGYGSESGTATGEDGSSNTEYYDRADELTVEVNVVIDSATGVTIADVRLAILEAFGTVNASETESRKAIGANVIYNALIGGAFDVEGVDDVTTFQIRFTGDAWGTSNLSVDVDEIATLALTDITVTGDVS